MQHLVLLSLICALTQGANVKTRFVLQEENDINYKRFLPILTKSGQTETVDLLAENITLYADASQVKYYLYTRKNPTAASLITSDNANDLKRTHFDRKLRTAFIVHGWTSSHESEINELLRDAILKQHDLNVIAVDWSPIASRNYITAKNAVVAVGGFVGGFISSVMREYRLTGRSFMMIGHSLGAHICGNAGQVLGGQIDHIVGLDPAGPLFSLRNIDNRLDETDAEHVEVIHTNGRLLGIGSASGNVDYYPNGGMVQAGCGLDLLGTCSHSLSYKFLAENIEFERKFIATECDSWRNFDRKNCEGNRKVIMAEINVDKSVQGDFFLKTNGKPPFALA